MIEPILRFTGDWILKHRLTWLVAAVSAAIVCSAAAADEWKTYRYPQDGFAADFPTPPDPQDQKPDPERMIRDHQYWSDKGDIAFGVGASLFHHKIIAAAPADTQLQNVIEGVRASLQCTVHSQRAIAFPGAAAREVVLDNCKKISGSAKQRIILAGDWLYQVMVLGTKDIAGDSQTKRFLESFSVTAR